MIEEFVEYGRIIAGMRTIPVFINVTMAPCPLGFMLSGEPPRCVCDVQLQANSISCDLTTQTVIRSGAVWVNASFNNNDSNGVILTKFCPNNYCKPERVSINLNHPDDQCGFNHSGILCGACQSGLSLSLGSIRCLRCSNDYIALLLPFALAGIALVALIKVLDLTVADGSLNGLIFYANIIQVNQDTLLPPNHQNILTVFIAWLNLDLGIETCFTGSLDAYWKTWLQFVFPLYIWGIVILIIVLCHYSSTAARIFGNNSVPVLATLVLISHTKLISTIVSILQSTTLYYPHGKTKTVWSYDGNIGYLSPKHIPLFLLAVVLLILCIVYTGVLLFAQCIQKTTNAVAIKVIAKLKPFFDAYFGPLKDKHRYWVGLLLLVRGVLFLVYGATPITSLSSINPLATGIAVLCLLVYPYGGWVYRKNYLNLLENSFFLNIGVLVLGSLYVQLSGGSQVALTYTSIGISFLLFIAVVAIRVFTLVRGCKRCGRLCRRFSVPHDPLPEEYTDTSESSGVLLAPDTVQQDRVMRLQISFSDFREPVLKYLN